MSIVLGAACGFPDISFSPEGADAGADDSSLLPDNPADTSGDDAGLDAPDDSQLLIDGNDPDALIAHDSGGSPIDAAACGATVCDCDKDGFNNTGKPGCNTGTNDCDDNDPRARPNQKFLEDTIGPPLFGDWNCSGAAEPLYATGVTCAGLTLGLGCDSIFGFSDQPGCGQSGTWIQCTRPSLLSLACAVGKTTTLTQACK